MLEIRVQYCATRVTAHWTPRVFVKQQPSAE